MNTSIKGSFSTANSNDITSDYSFFLHQYADFGIIITDEKGLVITCNLGAEQLFGIKKEETVGHPISIFYNQEDVLNRVPFTKLDNAGTNERVEYETVINRKNDSSFYAHTTVTALCNDDSSIKGFAIVVRDISLQKKLQQDNNQLTEALEEKVKQRTRELEIVVKELEAFSYSVSHDLRAPLRAISGYSIILQEDYSKTLDEEANRIINVIVDNTKMMSQLIDDLLTFSKMSRLEVVDHSVDMKKLVTRCSQELLNYEKRQNYSLQVNDLPECKGDENMLKQVWFNLISNAVKYSSKVEKPVIEIGFIEDTKSNIYWIRDNGTGFDMKYAHKLFGVFQRLHRMDEFEGTGLGLALVKRIISKHSGEIWAESSLNAGATFYFSIPKK